MSEGETKPTAPVLSFKIPNPPRDWNEAWRSFRQAHPNWPPAGGAAPLYCLPEPAVRELARAVNKRPAILNKEGARAEREFSRLCIDHFAVGCWEGRPVGYHLQQVVAPPTTAELQGTGWTPQQQTLALKLARGAVDACQRLKGYAGWLLTDPTFVQEAGALAARWHALPTAKRPTFPLGRTLLPRARHLPPVALPAHRVLARDVNTFLDRWGLTRLATWDLPEPQGPLLPNPLPPNSPALPTPGVHLILPLHYPLQGDDDLLRQVLDFQRQGVRALGLDESLAGLPHHKGYASLFEVLHLERSVLGRLPGRRVPHGFATHVQGALAAGLAVSLAQVQKCRKAISACLRGQRGHVAWLHPRAR
jgi:hypothetical protein